MLHFHCFIRSATFFLMLQYRQVPGAFLYRLIYYQVSGESGITGCSRRSNIYLGGVGGGLVPTLIH